MAVHGDKQQREREAALADFVANKRPLMVATDVAARGLDIKLVTHVVNYALRKVLGGDVDQLRQVVRQVPDAGDAGHPERGAPSRLPKMGRTWAALQEDHEPHEK